MQVFDWILFKWIDDKILVVSIDFFLLKVNRIVNDNEN